MWHYDLKNGKQHGSRVQATSHLVGETKKKQDKHVNLQGMKKVRNQRESQSAYRFERMVRAETKKKKKANLFKKG